MSRWFALLALAGAMALAQSLPNPWTLEQVIQPGELGKLLQQKKAPVILMVGPRVVYNGGHVKGAIFAGPAATEAGIRLLNRQVAELPADQRIVLYCGCCPMEKCPNIRPAFQALRAAAFKNVKVMELPANLYTDWTEKGYPVEKGNIEK